MSRTDELLEQLEISINGAARDYTECDKVFIHIGRATYLLSLLSMELESEMTELAQYRKAEEARRLLKLSEGTIVAGWHIGNGKVEPVLAISLFSTRAEAAAALKGDAE